MILNYFYPELATKVRIKSEKYCLDHSFEPQASQDSITIQELCDLSHKDNIDLVKVFIPKSALAYYIDAYTNEKIDIYGWVNIAEFLSAEPYS